MRETPIKEQGTSATEQNKQISKSECHEVNATIRKAKSVSYSTSTRHWQELTIRPANGTSLARVDQYLLKQQSKAYVNS